MDTQKQEETAKGYDESSILSSSSSYAERNEISLSISNSTYIDDRKENSVSSKSKTEKSSQTQIKRSNIQEVNQRLTTTPKKKVYQKLEHTIVKRMKLSELLQTYHYYNKSINIGESEEATKYL